MSEKFVTALTLFAAVDTTLGRVEALQSALALCETTTELGGLGQSIGHTRVTKEEWHDELWPLMSERFEALLRRRAA